jgi:hypothetical protein
MSYNDSGKPQMIETESTSGTYTKGRSSREIMNSIINATHKQQYNISFIFRESLRAIKEIFSGLEYIDSEDRIIDIKCIHGNPERTIAKLKQDNNIVLPIISVVQTSSEEDENRRKPGHLLLRTSKWVPEKQRAYRIVGFAPKAVNILYDVNVWTKYKSDLDQVSEQMHLRFHPSVNVVTTFNKETLGFLTQETDQSSVDLGDKEDRILRRSYSFKIQTWVPSPQFLVTATGKIETFNTEVELAQIISSL